MPGGSHGPTCCHLLVWVDFTRRPHATTFLHPPHAVGVLLNGEDLARVLLDAAVAFPDTAAFTWVLQGGAEVGSALLAERLLEDLELFAIAAWDGDGDLDGSVDVVDGSADAA